VGSLIKSLLLILSLGSVCFAQQDQPPAILSQFLGVNQNDPSVSIGNEAQDALNVESSLNGTALIKRSGYSRIASLTISTSNPTGAYSFVDTSGDKVQIVCQDHNCSKSINNAGFAVFLSTAGGTCMPTRWQFASIGGFVYAVNDCHDIPWRYDGTTRTPLPTAPLGSIIEATKDRLVISGMTADPSQVAYSQSGTPTNFTTGLNSADPYTDEMGAQGDAVRALKNALGRLYIFKTSSISSCILGDQYTSKCFLVSNSVGTSDPLSVVEVPGALLFRGSDGNYWSLDQTGINIISKKLSGLVASQNGGSTQSNTQTSQADWQAGTQYGAGAWNTYSAAGSVFPTSTTFSSLGVNTTDWSMVDVDTTLASVSQYVSNIDGNTLDSIWTVRSGTISVQSNTIVANTDNSGTTASASTPNSISTGIWSFGFQSTATASGDFEYWIVAQDTRTDQYTSGYALRMLQGSSAVDMVKISGGGPPSNGGTVTTIFSKSTISPYDGNYHTILVSLSTNGFAESFLDGAFLSSGTDTAGPIVTSHFTNFKFSGYPAGSVHASHLKLNGFYPNQESIAYNAAFSTPTWGVYGVNLTSATASSVTFRTQIATAATGPYGAFTSQTNGSVLSVSVTTAPYLRNSLVIAAPTSSFTPSISSWTLLSASTGQFVTQCIQPGTGITSWGQISCSQTTSGNGSLVFYATSAATCAGLPTVPPLTAAGATQLGWTSQTNNSTLSISTNAAVFVAFRSLLTAATDQAQIDACTLYWNNGTASQPSWGTFDPVKNAVYWTASINNSATSNRILKYDLNLNEWYPFGISATALFRDANQNALYFGDSTGGFWNKLGGVNSDNGSAINAYWISRDFGDQGNPFVDNNFNRISLVTKNQVSGNMTVAYSLSNAQSGSYSVSLSTNSGTTYVHSNAMLPQLSPAQFMNINLGNNSTNGFEVDALMLEYSAWPWSEQNP